MLRVTGVLNGSICAVILLKPKSCVECDVCAYGYIVTVAHSSNTCYVMLYNRGSSSVQPTMAGACWSVHSRNSHSGGFLEWWAVMGAKGFTHNLYLHTANLLNTTLCGMSANKLCGRGRTVHHGRQESRQNSIHKLMRQVLVVQSTVYIR